MSLDHPYARGNVPELGETETALKKVEADHKRMSDTAAKLEKNRLRR